MRKRENTLFSAPDGRDYSRFLRKCNGPAPKNAGKWVKNAKNGKKTGSFCQKQGRYRESRGSK